VESQHRRIFLLAAEASTGGGLDHPDLILLTPEAMRKRRVHVVRALKRALDHHDIAVDPCHHTLIFQVDVLLRPRLVRALYDHRCLGQDSIDVTLADDDVREDVVPAVLDAIGAWRKPEVENRRSGIHDDLHRANRPADRLS